MAALAKIGHNNPPVDPFDAFKMHFDDLRTEAGNWLDGSAIESQAQADEVSKLMDSLRSAAKDADKARAAEKKPHDDAGKAVQAKWKPLLDSADMAVDACKRVLAPWLQKLEAEKRAVAEAARMAAEAAHVAALAAMGEADATDLAARENAEALMSAAKKADATATRAANDKAHAVGGNRATGLRSYFRPVMTDAKAALVHYMAANPQAIKDCLLTLATQDVGAGKRQIPGFTVEEERRVV